MIITVNKNECVGCGACVSICPQTFRLNDEGKSEAFSQTNSDCAQSAADSCPVSAITVKP